MDEVIPHIRERLIQYFWGEVQIKEVGDPNSDYGEHFSTLNFPKTAVRKLKRKDQDNSRPSYGIDRLNAWLDGKQTLENGQPTLHDGSASFGLVRDKDNTQNYLATPQCLSNDQKELLLDLKKYIASRDKMSLKKMECMRMNIVKGAMTIQHTDILRCSMLPNFFIFFPPEKDDVWGCRKFSLTSIRWPNFKTSFVKFRNRICIPFEFLGCADPDMKFEYSASSKTGGHLQMIFFCKDSQKAKWLIVPPSCLHELEPYKRIKKNCAVLGLKGGRIRIASKKYKVHRRFLDDDSDMIDFDTLLDQSPDNDAIPTRKFVYMDEPNRLYRFNGWENIHYAEGDTSAIRMHIFMRNYRPIAVCSHANPRWGDSVVQVINK